jgi:hypothetical protein
MAHTRSTNAAAATVAAMENSEFEIPTLPNGTLLCLNIRSTWGDPFYVGLNGLEIFDGSGHAVAGDRVAAIWYADAVNATNSEEKAAAHPLSSTTAGRERGGGGSGGGGGSRSGAAAGEDPIRVVENLLDGENQPSLSTGVSSTSTMLSVFETKRSVSIFQDPYVCHPLFFIHSSLLLHPQQ